MVWIDMEMTGLSVSENRIIEIATVVTNKNLDVIAQGPNLVIHQSDEHLAKMDQWNQQTHGQSGLVDLVKSSQLDEQAAESQTLSFLQEYVEPGTSPLCGNSVHQDRFFIRTYMPQLDQFLHYRHLDVSVFKLAAYAFDPKQELFRKTDDNHRAQTDILQSISECRFYRDLYFNHLKTDINH
ncbi:oligoribonuclease [Gammaproteobacteria bacterium]|nr:oligoribonuclease [Gammaproteobacteria bacterium]